MKQSQIKMIDVISLFPEEEKWKCDKLKPTWLLS